MIKEKYWGGWMLLLAILLVYMRKEPPKKGQTVNRSCPQRLTLKTPLFFCLFFLIWLTFFDEDSREVFNFSVQILK